MKLGTTADGRQLTYDAGSYEFRVSGKPVSFDDVVALERRDWIRWRAPELRDWFAEIDRDAIVACSRAARGKRAGAGAEGPKLRYRSTDPSVASVDDAGLVSVRGSGTADILVARMADSGFTTPLRLVTIVVGEQAGAREIRKGFKAKGGRLAKAKSFKLPAVPEGACGYEKVSGDAGITVSGAGKVTVEKGLACGLHTAEVAVRGGGGFPSLIVAVEVK